MKIQTDTALLAIDIQNDFCEGGALAVRGGQEVVPIINELMGQFPVIVATQDWHTPGHSSFASVHSGKNPFDTTPMPYGEQVLWPDHCVQGTAGAEFHSDFELLPVQLIVRKGFHQTIDSYSAFYENDHKTSTGLTGYLKERKINRLYVCGLATDFCVKWTALDAVSQGFLCTLIEDASRAIDLNGSLEACWKELEKAGVEICQSREIL